MYTRRLCHKAVVIEGTSPFGKCCKWCSLAREGCTRAPRVTTCGRMCALECRVDAYRLPSQKRRSQTKLHVSTARHKRCSCCKRMCRSDECRAESAAVAIYFEPTEEDEIGCGRGSDTSSIVSLVRVQTVFFAHVPRV